MCEQDRELWRRLSPRRLCSDGSMSVTLIRLMSGLHQSFSVCEGYDRVETVSEGGHVCTTSNCLPLPLLFLLLLPLIMSLSLFETLIDACVCAHHTLLCSTWTSANFHPVMNRMHTLAEPMHTTPLSISPHSNLITNPQSLPKAGARFSPKLEFF